MPHYDFRCVNENCKSAGKVVDVKCSMDEILALEPACPECGEIMKRKFHRLAVNKRQPLGSTGEIYTDLQSAEDQLFSMITEDHESGD
jgi:predicted nucleic acid-binding Zn ribbon protein